MRISDWSSDVCSSDLHRGGDAGACPTPTPRPPPSTPQTDASASQADTCTRAAAQLPRGPAHVVRASTLVFACVGAREGEASRCSPESSRWPSPASCPLPRSPWPKAPQPPTRSEEHTSELQSLMRISYAVFCLKKKKNIDNIS